MTPHTDQEDDEVIRTATPTPMPIALPSGKPGAPAAPAPADVDAAAPGEAATPEPPPIMDEHGAFTPEWYTHFAELEPYAATLAKFHRPEALAKSYANLERLKGYPGLDDARRMAAFRTAVGLPATAEEFGIPRPEGMPEEVWDAAMAARIARVAYEYGVPAAAMQALSESYAGESRRMLDSMREAQERAVEEADATLQEEWGRRYEDNMRTIADFLQTMGERSGVDVQHLLENPALRADADFAKLILTASSMLEEAPMHEGSPADGRSEAHRIAHDPTHPLHEAYMRTSHPQHRYANEQYDRLAFGRA